MSNLIDRRAAIDAILAVTGNSSVRELYEHVQEHGLSDMWSGGVNAAIDVIIAVPAAQPEIIRCRDCAKYKTVNCAMDVWMSDIRIYTAKPDDFCSKAERRQNG